MEDYTCFVELIVIPWILVNNRCAVQFREFAIVVGILCGFMLNVIGYVKSGMCFEGSGSYSIAIFPTIKILNAQL